MSSFVLRCGDGPLPISLASVPAASVSPIPSAAELDDVWPMLATSATPRLIVVGTDAALAAVLTRLLRTERLHVELGYVALERSAAARIYRTGTGSAAAGKALNGTAEALPLIRDDTGRALVGTAVVTGPEGAALDGEAYVDDSRLFVGSVPEVEVAPVAAMPGVRARVQRRSMRRGRWLSGRAAQFGSPAAVVVRDGVRAERPVPRVSFYRHDKPWLLVH